MLVLRLGVLRSLTRYRMDRKLYDDAIRGIVCGEEFRISYRDCVLVLTVCVWPLREIDVVSAVGGTRVVTVPLTIGGL